MAYQTLLSVGQTLVVAQQGRQTEVTLTTLKFGQHQTQQMSVTTGNWVAPPVLFKTSSAGWILRIDTQKNQSFIHIQANGIRVLSETPLLKNVDIIRLEEIPDFEPVYTSPMETDNFEERFNLMRNFTRHVNRSVNIPSRFCPNCGNSVKVMDRFCSHCGQALQQNPA
jgi:NADH pyrophosphatase NudC (nudix superfamily)